MPWRAGPGRAVQHHVRDKASVDETVVVVGELGGIADRGWRSEVVGVGCHEEGSGGRRRWKGL